MDNEKVDSEQLNRSFSSADAVASAIITGVFAKEEEEGYGNFDALQKEATKWIEDYANGTEEEAGRAASDVNTLVIGKVLRLLDNEIEYWLDTADEWADKKKYGKANVNRSMAEGIRHVHDLIEQNFSQ